jgi:hypothetical protein
MMTAFGEQVVRRRSTARFVHQVVDDNPSRLVIDGYFVIYVDQSFVKRYVIDRLEARLPFSVAICDVNGRLRAHSLSRLDQTQQQTRFATTRRPRDNGRKR